MPAELDACEDLGCTVVRPREYTPPEPPPFSYRVCLQSAMDELKAAREAAGAAERADGAAADDELSMAATDGTVPHVCPSLH